jgi:flagellar basal body-associated protein FliL
MSEEPEKPAEGAAPKKGKAGLIIGIVIAGVTLVGGSVAGAVLGPKLLGGSDEAAEKPAKSEKSSKGHKSEKSEKSESHGEGDEGEGPEKITNVDVSPVVVDLRDADGRIRHLKVGLTAELSEKVTPEEFKLYAPRGREALLTYLRTLTFEDVSDPPHFLIIKEEIAKRVIEAVGEDRVHRLMLTDFVLQ